MKIIISDKENEATGEPHRNIFLWEYETPRDDYSGTVDIGDNGDLVDWSSSRPDDFYSDNPHWELIEALIIDAAYEYKNLKQ